MSDTLLLADDSVTMQRVVELTFAEQGLTVVSVGNGQQAIDHLTRQRPALALVSATLPRVNGFDVARFVRDQLDNRVPVLLLAGAFDNLDEAQVRDCGASGVLVKPFEPSVVIKRVKELLGMKTEPPRPTAERPPTPSSGRMLTSSEGPARIAPMPAPEAAAVTAEAPREAPAEQAAWERLREQSGLRSGAAPVAAPAPTGDYLDHLDAAFDSLDAQLAGSAAPASRANHAPTGLSMPAAIEPARRPTAAMTYSESTPPRDAATSATNGASSAVPSSPKPVFEVDDNWFDKKPAAVDSLSDLTEFVVTRATDYTPAPPTPSGPAGDSGGNHSWLPGAVQDRRDDERDASSEVRDKPDAPAAGGRPDATDASARGPGPSTPADAFAVLWAQDQGGAQPGTPLADQVAVSKDLAPRLAEEISARLLNDLIDRLGPPLLERLTETLSERLSSAVSDRVSAVVADRLSSELSERLTSTLGHRLVATVNERLSAATGEVATGALAERISGPLGERLSSDLAERVVEGTMNGALGEQLRQTVHNVAERVVRAEIERIKAAAEARR